MKTIRPYAIAIALVLAFFAIAEHAYPYFFLQDDNRDQYLPFLVHNYRAAQAGQLAQYNFYQSLGHPHLALGYTGTLQPFTYVAVFLSDTLWGHPYACVDLLVLIYALLGAIGAVKLLKLLELSDAAAIFGAITWALFPLNLHTSQSWLAFPPVIGALPWLLVAIILIYRGRSIGGGALFIAGHAAIFYSGGQQFVIYAGLVQLFLLVWLFIAERRWIVIRDLLVIGALTAGFVAPLLLPMWRVMQVSAFRNTAMDMAALTKGKFAVLQLLNGLLYPFHRFYTPAGDDYFVDYLPLPVTHLGYLGLLLLVVYPFLRRSIEMPRRRVIDACFVATVICIVGALGGWTVIIAWLPLLNRFRWPFKVLPFAVAPAIVCMAAALDAHIARRKLAAWAGALAVALQFGNLAILDLSFEKHGFAEHYDPIPLNEPLANRLRFQRAISIGCHDDAHPKHFTGPALAYDYATLFEVYHFAGYDPLMSERTLRSTLHLNYPGLLCGNVSNIPFNLLRAWGVRIYIIDLPMPPDYFAQLAAHRLRVAYKDAERVVMIDPYAAPLAGSRACSAPSLRSDGDDLVVDVNCRQPDDLVIRFLFEPDFDITVDGVPARARQNGGGQIVLPVPAGRHHVRVAYDDLLFDVGLTIAMFTAGVAAAICLVGLLRRRKAAR